MLSLLAIILHDKKQLFTTSTGMRSNTNLIIIFAFLFLTLVSVWGFKNINEWARSTIKALGILFLQGILGLGINAQPYASQRLKISCADATAHVQLYAMQLIASDALIMLRANEVADWMPKISLGILLASLAAYHLHMPRLHSLIYTLGLLITTTTLGYYVLLPNTECYWTVGLLIVLILNYFAPRFLALVYDIPQAEVRVIGLCNFVIFAVNSINEIADIVKLTDDVKKRLLQV